MFLARELRRSNRLLDIIRGASDQLRRAWNIAESTSIDLHLGAEVRMAPAPDFASNPFIVCIVFVY
jgi:hypothetical protein